MTMFSAPSSMTAFLTHQGQATVADFFADTHQPGEPALVRQLCVLCRLNIGVVLATNPTQRSAGGQGKAYEHVQSEHNTVPDSLVLQLCHTACGYMADLDHNTTA